MMTMMQQNLLSSVIERIIKVEFLPRLADAHSCCKDIMMEKMSSISSIDLCEETVEAS